MQLAFAIYKYFPFGGIQRDLVKCQHRYLKFPGLSNLGDRLFVQGPYYQVGAVLDRLLIQGPGVSRVAAVVKTQKRAPFLGQFIVSRQQAVAQCTCNLGVFTRLRQQHGDLPQTLIAGFPCLQIAVQ